jgi:hypothetical protein
MCRCTQRDLYPAQNFAAGVCAVRYLCWCGDSCSGGEGCVVW